MIRTIPKNTNQARRILAEATRCVAHTLDNHFVGHECEPHYAAEALAKHPHAKLRLENGRHVVHVHANLWFDLYC